MTTDKEKVLALVSQIPHGQITSYGDIAAIIGLTPRTVGFIMTGLSYEESQKYPWQRVVNRDGFISASKLGERGEIQQQMLLAEGLKIKDYQIIEPKKYWFYFERKEGLF